MKEYRFRINGNDYSVAINSISGNIADVSVNGTPYQVELENTDASEAYTAPVEMRAPEKKSSPEAVPTPAAPKTGTGQQITSPLPGVIIAVKVNVGDTVKAGQTVAVLEAMKMENDICSPADGTVATINVAQGASVTTDEVLVTLN